MPAVLQLSTVPWDVSGKCQGCNSSNEGERTVLPILHTQGSVQLDEEFNNVRMPPLSICADHPAFATWERTKWKPFYWDPTSQLSQHSREARAWNCWPNADILWKNCCTANAFTSQCYPIPSLQTTQTITGAESYWTITIRFYLLLSGIGPATYKRTEV